MKSHLLQRLTLLLLLTVCSIACLEEHDDLVPDLEGVPAGGMTNVEILSINGNEMELGITLFIVDHFGSFIDNLSPDNFLLELFGDYEGTIAELLATEEQERGSFSSTLLFDQSGSIAATDPGNSRVEAGISFAEIVADGDEASVVAFTNGGSFQSPYQILQGFTTNQEELKESIRILAGREGGGTPLYRSVFDLIAITDDAARNDNRAIIAFTDGADTEGGVTTPQIIQEACARGVRIYTIGLGGGVDTKGLSEIAFRTGGAVMLAEDAIQLVSLYSSLGALLHGDGKFYNLTIKLTKTNGEWQPNQVVNGELSIPLSENFDIRFPFQKLLTRENAGSIEERVPECSCADQGEENIVKKWKDEADKYLSRNQSNDIVNQSITCAYTEVYSMNPEKFKWAGLGAIVSGIIGLEDKANSIIPDAPFDLSFSEKILKGNRAVFDDLLWQHLAFNEKGISEIEKIYCTGEIDKSIYSAWLKIAQDDSDLVWEGNKDLLYHEQSNILQPSIYDPVIFIPAWNLVEVLGKVVSPVPNHGDKFPDDKDINNLDHRWNWIETSILPAWRAYESNASNANALKMVHQNYCPNCCQ